MAFNMGSMFGSGGATGALSSIMQLLMYVCYAIIVGGLIFLVYWMFIRKNMVFKYGVTIFKQQGDSIVVLQDRARIKKSKENKYCLDFYNPIRKNISAEVPSLNYIMINQKGSPQIFLHQYGELDYAIVDIKGNLKKTSLNLKSIPITRFNLCIQKQKEIAMKYITKDWWDKFGTSATIISCMLIMLFFFFVQLKYGCKLG